MMWNKLVELDLFNARKKIGIANATPAQILQKILMDSWTLKENDRDMIVMHHKFGYKFKDNLHQIESSLFVEGESQTFTAMAKTVGLPMAIVALKILNGEITTPGVQIPISKEVYEAVLKELKEYGVIFTEKKVPHSAYYPQNRFG